MPTRGSLAVGYYRLRRYNSADALIYDSGNLSNSFNCIGSKETLDPAASGFFKPGTFRVNPVVIEKSTGTCSGAELVSHKRAYNANWYHTSGTYMTYWVSQASIASVAWYQNLANWALESAFAKFNEAQVDFALILGELGETLAMLRNPLKGLLKLLNTLRQTFRTVGPLVTFAADTHLLYRYGISPLIKDIEDTIQAFNNKAAQFVKGQMYRKKSRKVTTSTTTTLSTRQSVGEFYVTPVWTKEISYQATANVFAQFVIDIDTKWDPARYGFDPRQLPALMWELVPFSFVVDWFWSVGTWLRAIMPLPHLNYLGNCVSIKSIANYQLEGLAPLLNFGDAATKVGITGKYTWHAEKLERKIMTTMPVMPALTVDKYGFLQKVDSLALLWGQIQRSLNAIYKGR